MIPGLFFLLGLCLYGGGHVNAANYGPRPVPLPMPMPIMPRPVGFVEPAVVHGAPSNLAGMPVTTTTRGRPIHVRTTVTMPDGRVHVMTPGGGLHGSVNIPVGPSVVIPGNTGFPVPAPQVLQPVPAPVVQPIVPVNPAVFPGAPLPPVIQQASGQPIIQEGSPVNAGTFVVNVDRTKGQIPESQGKPANSIQPVQENIVPGFGNFIPKTPIGNFVPRGFAGFRQQSFRAFTLPPTNINLGITEARKTIENRFNIGPVFQGRGRFETKVDIARMIQPQFDQVDLKPPVVQLPATRTIRLPPTEISGPVQPVQPLPIVTQPTETVQPVQPLPVVTQPIEPVQPIPVIPQPQVVQQGNMYGEHFHGETFTPITHLERNFPDIFFSRQNNPIKIQNKHSTVIPTEQTKTKGKKNEFPFIWFPNFNNILKVNDVDSSRKTPNVPSITEQIPIFNNQRNIQTVAQVDQTTTGHGAAQTVANNINFVPSDSFGIPAQGQVDIPIIEPATNVQLPVEPFQPRPAPIELPSPIFTRQTFPTTPVTDSSQFPVVEPNPSTDLPSPVFPTQPIIAPVSDSSQFPFVPPNPSTDVQIPTFPSQPVTDSTQIPFVPPNPSTAVQIPTFPSQPITDSTQIPFVQPNPTTDLQFPTFPEQPPPVVDSTQFPVVNPSPPIEISDPVVQLPISPGINPNPQPVVVEGPTRGDVPLAPIPDGVVPTFPATSNIAAPLSSFAKPNSNSIEDRFVASVGPSASNNIAANELALGQSLVPNIVAQPLSANAGVFDNAASVAANTLSLQNVDVTALDPGRGASFDATANIGDLDAGAGLISNRIDSVSVQSTDVGRIASLNSFDNQLNGNNELSFGSDFSVGNLPAAQFPIIPSVNRAVGVLDHIDNININIDPSLGVDFGSAVDPSVVASDITTRFTSNNQVGRVIAGNTIDIGIPQTARFEAVSNKVEPAPISLKDASFNENKNSLASKSSSGKMIKRTTTVTKVTKQG